MPPRRNLRILTTVFVACFVAKLTSVSAQKLMNKYQNDLNRRRTTVKKD